MNCSICCYLILQKYNLYSNAYSQLTVAYKYLLTLPCTQVIFVKHSRGLVACERSFSILKLRNTLNESKHETFMIMSIEKDILFNINIDEVFDRLKTKSNLLTKWSSELLEISKDTEFYVVGMQFPIPKDIMVDVANNSSKYTNAT
ncbi:Uncharacterized protein FWK35_00026492 [Aphis craccivora]|uniref:Zinc finger MYM-type protein 1-like n=1 Tax=Aphis craccivora TaxID=307492 RepID=A0A6G0VVU5_APHCR|nr:Uncharacterized protein FWK35_00026492 [Aphis craccivora]